MVRGTLSDDHLKQLNVVTGTFYAQKYQDEILESGVRSPLDSLDGQNMVLQDDNARTHCTRIIEDRTLLSSTAQHVARLKPYRTRVGQAQLTCFKPETSRIKTIVNFARLYCMSGTGFHVLNACSQ